MRSSKGREFGFIYCSSIGWFPHSRKMKIEQYRSNPYVLPLVARKTEKIKMILTVHIDNAIVFSSERAASACTRQVVDPGLEDSARSCLLKF